MVPQKNKTNINPKASAPRSIAIISSLGIDDSSYFSKLLNYSMSVTPDKITPQKMELTVIRNMPKTDHGGYDSLHTMGNINELFQISLTKTVTEHNAYDEASFYVVVKQDAERQQRLSKYLSQLNF